REWLQNQGNCYAYFDQQLTWHEAEIECQSYGRGAHLASILTKAETLLVAEHVSTYQREFSNVWIGLHDKRRWRWTDESTYNYKAWMIGWVENINQVEQCAELMYFSGKSTLLTWWSLMNQIFILDETARTIRKIRGGLFNLELSHKTKE
uniref:C-type lectin domain-containing protein n=1 Tax=Naja naja TaxID=35670 RepID=A0A8C6XEE7_NAJNA